ncbi:MAG: DUF1493 family protein [Bacteroidota bacterium]
MTIERLIQTHTGAKNIRPDTDIYLDLKFAGDDFEELLADYAKTYAVDMRGYLWYFHNEEEGFNIGALFVAPPNRRVTRIPVSPALLAEFANKGVWDMSYPAHELPAKRYGHIINTIIGLLFAAMVGIALFFKWFA